MDCPTCGQANPETAQFCTACHAVLIYKCPSCWHEQRHGGTCEKCGLNFNLYWSLALNRAADERAREDVARFKSTVGTLAQLALLPFTGARSLLRFLLARLLLLGSRLFTG